MSRPEPLDVFRVSVIEGVFLLREHIDRYPSVPRDQAIGILRRQASSSSLGWTDVDIVVEDCPELLGLQLRDDHLNIRAVLLIFLRKYQPIWMRTIPRGRRHVSSGAPENAVQCLNRAKLMTNHDDDVIEWWDQASQIVREQRNEMLIETGRTGEKMSFVYELARLNSDPASPTLVPELVSLDDNTLGYDIRSFVQPNNNDRLFIEVKAANRGSEFYVTRNEWNVCRRHRARYVVHFWIIPQKKLNYITPDDLANHIPADQGQGEWDRVKVCWS
jgi:Domain of unknown function (DUF3883)